jgi:hypothetical protein
MHPEKALHAGFGFESKALLDGRNGNENCVWSCRRFDAYTDSWRRALHCAIG